MALNKKASEDTDSPVSWDASVHSALMLTGQVIGKLVGSRNDGMKTNNYRSYQDGLHPHDGVKGYTHDGINQNRTEYGTHNNTKMEEAHDVANQLVTTQLVKSANVLLTDHNAYVAISTQNGEDIDGSNEAKKRITDQVKKMRLDIHNVYISANPDFVSRVNGYMQDIRAGKPVSGLIHEFNVMVKRVFPTRTAQP